MPAADSADRKLVESFIRNVALAYENLMRLQRA